ncbi:MAG TPA: GntR family transcriptional regulator, partial [Casimicrobiaceae bacterium]
MIKPPSLTGAKPPRGNLTAQVLRDLSARIERGELSPGDRLPPERRLMEDYRVSRTVVREAISSLRAS